ncbi:hypothetical protein J4481_01395 [Candidatus Pacearchaeota archaeon]|nr:hypothetical protein [Candidatus Pacearchaeota archaeon]
MKNELITKIILTTTRLFINYIKYFFLTSSVIFSLFVLLFIILNINPNFSFGFIQYFSFINPTYETGTFNLNIKEIMEIFLVVSFVLMIIANLIKLALKKIFNLENIFTSKLKITIFFSIITLAYITASLIVAFSPTLEKGFYFVFIIFYIINIFSAICYFALDFISKKFFKLINSS